MTQPLDENWVPIGEAWLRALEKMVAPKPPADQKSPEPKEKAA